MYHSLSQGLRGQAAHFKIKDKRPKAKEKKYVNKYNVKGFFITFHVQKKHLNA